MQEVDVIVIGGGSAGEVLAAALSGEGMSVTVVEERLLGGQCPFWACMPAKALLRPGTVSEEMAAVPGLRRAAIDPEAVFAWRDDVADRWDDHRHVHELQSDGVELVRGRGRIRAPRVVEIESSDGDSRSITASRAVVIGTGARPAPIPIEGSDRIQSWTSEDVTTASEVPARMLVIGGGPVGLESAQAYAWLGSDVTVVEAETRILPREDRFVSEVLSRELETRGLRIVCGETVEWLEPVGSSTTVKLSSGDRLDVDRVVSAMGRVPNTEDLGLQELGVEAGGPLQVDGSMRVVGHEEWLYAIGDVNGRSMFTHSAKQQARIAAAVISGSVGSVAPSERAVPRCVFTDPVVAATGMTETEARSQGIDVVVTSADVGMLAEAGIWGTEVRGEARAVWSDGRLIGAAFVGPSPLIEMLTSFQVAIIGELTVDTLRSLVPQFPSFSELWLDLLP